MATANDGAPLSALPDDVLQRILVGVPLDDHRVAAAACRAFHDVINGPRFPALRRKYGFAEYGVVVVDDTGDRVDNRVVSIRMAQQIGAMATISGPCRGPGDSDSVAHACAHKGRVVVFLQSDAAFERGNDGTWSPFSYGVREEDSRYAQAVSGSVLLG